MKKIVAVMTAFEGGEIPDPRPIAFADIEGTDLQSAFDEPIWLPNIYPSKTEFKSKE